MKRGSLGVAVAGLLLVMSPLAAEYRLTNVTGRFFLGEVSDLIQYVAGLAEIDPLRPRDQRELYRYYLSRQFRPIWVTKTGIRGQPGRFITQATLEAQRHGLDPEDYHLEELSQLLAVQDTDAARLARLDMLLTDAVWAYGRDVRDGRLSATAAGGEWRIAGHAPLTYDDLIGAVKDERLSDWLNGLPPPHAGYRSLQTALTHLQLIAQGGGWPRIDNGSILRRGDRGKRVLQLRQRLGVSAAVAAPTRFDDELADAVRAYQQRNGLPAHGMVDGPTLASLNVTVEQRMEQVLINMLRWRWLPRQLPRRYLLINMAGFTLRYVEDGETRLQMKVIIGKDYRQTPVFSSRVTGVVINPSWYVPYKVLVEDLLPTFRQHPAMVEAMGMEVIDDVANGGGEVVDPRQVDWKAAQSGYFPYVLRQRPGPDNALGRFKFIVENSNGIYLHDTNHPGLFSRTVRAFSSGCIRLEQPEQLAATLLNGQQGWDARAIHAAAERGESNHVALQEPVPVFFLYLTAWSDDEGQLHFRDDVYGRDQQLQEVARPVTRLESFSRR